MTKQSKKIRQVMLLLGAGLVHTAVAEEESVVEMGQFPVYAGAYGESMKVAAIQLGDRMNREVRVDMQTRGGPGYQSDISIRGGIFEGTGLQIDGLALFDPQTGHYFSEIPLDPGFFTGAQLLTGVNNSINGFNSSAGSIDWIWAPMEASSRISATVGSDRRYGGSIRTGWGEAGGTRWQMGMTHDRSDGSIRDGDFRMDRISARMEMPLGQGNLRLFGGHVEKFFGWPGMYTGFANLSETEDYAVSLIGWQWESGEELVGDMRHHHRVGGYWRRLDDDYEFNRYAPNALFEHLTEVWSLQGNGLFSTGQVNLSYRWVLLQDRIRRSTSLVNGYFTKRDYAKLGILAEGNWETSAHAYKVYGGMGLDTSSEDQTVGTPQLGISWSTSGEAASWTLYTEYSRSSQVPGYTILNSRKSGLFGGNPDLGREMADLVEVGLQFQSGQLTAQIVVFQRDDADLVDWIYDSSTPSARQASAMDLRVRGIEGWMRWEAGASAIEAGYASLDKDPAYLDGTGDASFYALNYARHRLMVGLEQTLLDDIEIRVEGEYRNHAANALRNGGQEAIYLNFHVTWRDFPAQNWSLYFSADNLTEESFEPVPGTPGRGREFRGTLSYSW